MYRQISGFVARKFNGKILGVETYVLRKVKTFEKDDFTRTLLPVLELIGLWNVNSTLLIYSKHGRVTSSCLQIN